MLSHILELLVDIVGHGGQPQLNSGNVGAGQRVVARVELRAIYCLGALCRAKAHYFLTTFVVLVFIEEIPCLPSQFWRVVIVDDGVCVIAATTFVDVERLLVERQ